jgi:hypothetical protein
MKKLFLVLAILLLAVGCQYQRGDRVELMNGKIGVVSGVLSSTELIVVIFDENQNSTRQLVDTIEIKRKLPKTELTAEKPFVQRK